MLTVVLTGSSGLACALAHELISRGFRVIVGARDPGKAADTMKKKLGERINRIHFHTLDLTSFASVISFTSELLRGYSSIDLLINNAAVCSWKERFTHDGFEESLQVNYLSPFLLTNRLVVLLSASKLKTILCIGTHTYELSESQLLSKTRQKQFDMVNAYRDSKMYLGAMCEEITYRYESEGLRGVWLNPGLMRTRLGVSGSGLLGKIGFVITCLIARSPNRAAKNLLNLLERNSIPEMQLPSLLKMRESRIQLWNLTDSLIRANLKDESQSFLKH